MNISLQELANITAPHIIDIRPPLNYNNGHIPKAINIPYNSLIINPSKYLNKNENYYIYCKKGITSAGLCKLLSNMGYKTYSISGGYENWVLNQ